MINVALLGRYNNTNWGGQLTVLCTYQTVKDLGFSVKMLRAKGHRFDKSLIYNQICDFTKVDLNNPKPPSSWNDYFDSFILCSDWSLKKNGGFHWILDYLSG